MQNNLILLILLFACNAIAAKETTAEITINAKIAPTCDVDVIQTQTAGNFTLQTGTNKIHLADVNLKCNVVNNFNLEIIIKSSNGFKFKFTPGKTDLVPVAQKDINYKIMVTGVDATISDINPFEKKISSKPGSIDNNYAIYLEYTADELTPGNYDDDLSFNVQT